jgi:hypothetical protein
LLSLAFEGVPKGVLAVAAFLMALSFSGTAEAYSWMVRNGYTQCRVCHVDPSGSGVLTTYGRAMAEYMLTMPQGGASVGEESRAPEFLWGAVSLPDEVLLGGDLRVMRLAQKVEEVPLQTRLIYMQLDAEAAIVAGRFVASASLGYAHEGALDAALTRGAEKSLVSRQHWLGYALVPELLLLRAGRMNLPFGVRSIEHTLWARALTRTSIDDDQQYGLSLSLESEHVRGELMGIAGNLQTRPDEYRERGYSAYVEWMPNNQLALGASSLLTHRELDPSRLTRTYRHAHGLMARWHTPYDPLVVLSEWDYLLETPRGGRWRSGIVGYAQADFEPSRGVHLMLTLEANNVSTEDNAPFSYGTWLSYAWFFLPHTDLRLDSIYQSIASSTSRRSALAWLAQIHVYL